MCGKMEQRKLLNKLTWILLISRVLQRMKKSKLRMKLTELLMLATILKNHLWTKLKLKRNMALTFTKEVLFQAIH